MSARSTNRQILEAGAHRLTSLEFFGALHWIDGRPLLDVIEPYRRRIFEAVLDTFDADRRPTVNLALCGRGKKSWKTADEILAAVDRLLVTGYPKGNQCYLFAADELASELVRLKVDVLLGIGGDIGEAFKNATGTIPIVVASSADPVRAHLVVSLARPGGNLTGMSFISDEMAAKRVELLREAMPRVSRLGILWDPGHVDSDFLEVQRATRRLG